MKKHIYQLEKQKAGLQESYHDLEANERTSLMSGGPSSVDMANTDAFFIPLLDRELRKICVFYETEEQRLTDDLAALQTDIERQEESGPYAGHHYLDEEEDEEDEEDDDFQLQSPTATLSRDRTQSPSRRRKRSMSSAGAKGVYFAARPILSLSPFHAFWKCTHRRYPAVGCSLGPWSARLVRKNATSVRGYREFFTCAVDPKSQ